MTSSQSLASDYVLWIFCQSNPEGRTCTSSSSLFIHPVLISAIYPGISCISVFTSLQHTYPIWIEWSEALPRLLIFRGLLFEMNTQKPITLSDLPLELLLMVAEDLSPVDVACLALCNRRLLSSLGSACCNLPKGRTGGPEDGPRIDFLTRLSRDLPLPSLSCLPTTASLAKGGSTRSQIQTSSLCRVPR